MDSGQLTFVGFGFGPIQAGLFLLEAARSQAFRRLVVAEVLADAVRSIRQAGGVFRVNVAYTDRVEAHSVGPIEIENPEVPEDRERILRSIEEASEISTAIPSVRFYRSDSPGSVHRVLAEGLQRRFASSCAQPVIIYTAENHNRAAEILEEAVLEEVSPASRDAIRRGAQFLNTVIGKMSGVVSPGDERSLEPFVPGASRVFLVESFRRIYISKIRFGADSGFRRGISVFEEKEDLLPFEEAKLYGHNAAHALAAYLAAELGKRRMDELREIPEAVAFVRAAFLEESGEALIAKWSGKDPLFTREGFRAYVDDLIERMLNPYLGDLVERVGRDPARKLGWDDRLVGTIRLAISFGIWPSRYALGVALALAAHDRSAVESDEKSEAALWDIWRPAAPNREEVDAVLRITREGLAALRAWRRTGVPPFRVADRPK